jgi:hypothetical protein
MYIVAQKLQNTNQYNMLETFSTLWFESKPRLQCAKIWWKSFHFIEIRKYWPLGFLQHRIGRQKYDYIFQ